MAVTDRCNPPGHDAGTQPVAVTLTPAGTITTGPVASGAFAVQSTNPGIVTAALTLTALVLFSASETLTTSSAVSAGNIRCAVPFPLRATVELNVRLQERLIGTTVT